MKGVSVRLNRGDVCGSDNYDMFDSMRENAYNKAVNNYTTKHFVEKYLM